MKLVQLFTFIFITVCSGVNACSSDPDSFCASINHISVDLGVIGKITSVDSDGIDLQIIETFKGVETKEVIRIWDGTDFDCFGLYSMAASDLGNLNDTIIVLLPKIDETINDWDVIGDYRRPDYANITSDLSIENGRVKGFIKGIWGPNPNDATYELSYQDFYQALIVENNCIKKIVGIGQKAMVQFDVSYTNPVKDNLIIEIEGLLNDKTDLTVLTSTGGQVANYDVTGSHFSIDFSSYAQGVYYIRLSNGFIKTKTFKVTKL